MNIDSLSLKDNIFLCILEAQSETKHHLDRNKQVHCQLRAAQRGKHLLLICYSEFFILILYTCLF